MGFSFEPTKPVQQTSISPPPQQFVQQTPVQPPVQQPVQSPAQQQFPGQFNTLPQTYPQNNLYGQPQPNLYGQQPNLYGGMVGGYQQQQGLYQAQQPYQQPVMGGYANVAYQQPYQQPLGLNQPVGGIYGQQPQGQQNWGLGGNISLSTPTQPVQTNLSGISLSTTGLNSNKK